MARVTVSPHSHQGLICVSLTAEGPGDDERHTFDRCSQVNATHLLLCRRHDELVSAPAVCFVQRPQVVKVFSGIEVEPIPDITCNRLGVDSFVDKDEDRGPPQLLTDPLSDFHHARPWNTPHVVVHERLWLTAGPVSGFVELHAVEDSALEALDLLA